MSAPTLRQINANLLDGDFHQRGDLHCPRCGCLAMRDGWNPVWNNQAVSCPAVTGPPLESCDCRCHEARRFLHHEFVTS